MNAPGMRAKNPLPPPARWRRACTGVTSTPHARQVLLWPVGVERVATHMSQKNFRHLGQKNRAGIFPWNLQNVAPADIGPPAGAARGGGNGGSSSTVSTA